MIESRMLTSLQSVETARRRVWVLLALAGVMGVVTAFVPRVAQDPAYHNFADTRAALGIPNFLNVVSNLPFLVVGALGLAFLARDTRRGGADAFASPAERRPYWPFFTGVALTFEPGPAFERAGAKPGLIAPLARRFHRDPQRRSGSCGALGAAP